MNGRSAVRRFAVGSDAVERVIAAKSGRTISLCIPCRDEAATIGPLVRMIRTELIDDDALPAPLVDELIVLDDRSTDDTASVARHAGATVVPIDAVHARYGPGHGKGNALWASLAASHGDVVIWMDGDLTSFTPLWIAKLAVPLLEDPDARLVKGMFHRPQQMGGGGRTTELVARPLMSLYFPDLVGLDQPLAGEYAMRRETAEQLSFSEGWGVEIALLIDVARRWGADTITQVELGVREHRHRSLQTLSVQAAEVLATMLDRVPAGSVLPEGPRLLRRSDGSSVKLNLAERPPLVHLHPADAD